MKDLHVYVVLFVHSDKKKKKEERVHYLDI